jgi:adenosylcobinamide-GDP ribazoletransferase
MVGLLRAGRPARPDGLGRLFAGRIGTGELATAAIPLLLASLMLAMVASSGPGWGTVAFEVGAIAAVFALGSALARLCARVFGGITGDTAGAAGEVAEILYLLLVLAWLRLSI